MDGEPKMAKRFLKLLMFAAAASLSAPAMAANLITNGDFEGAVVSGTPTGWTLLPYSVAPTVFTADAKVLSGADYVNNAGGTGSAAAQANKFLSFGPGNLANVEIALANPVNTIAGQLYELKFDFAQFGTAATETLTYAITGTGILQSGTETQAGGTNLDTIFQSHTIFFTGTGNPINVLFTLAGQPTAGVDGLLDNVVVTAVPEAATWAVMLLGVGMLGIGLRRRRSGSGAMQFA